MSNARGSDSRPLGDDSPFHQRGYIGPQHRAAWAAMKWHSDTLRLVIRDLNQIPPEFVLIRAPAFGGKTTFAMQLMYKLEEENSGILAIYLPFGGANATHARFLEDVRDNLIARLTAWLESNEEDQLDSVQIRDAMNSWASLRASNLAELLRKLLWQIPEAFRRVVFVLDDCEVLASDQLNLIAEELRSIHATRRFGPLSRFSVVVLARSLLRYPTVISPLAGVVKEYRLEDFTFDDTQQFLSRCGDALEGSTFDPEAVRYLYQKTQGQSVAVQRICSSATKSTVRPSVVQLTDILQGICACFETGGGFVHSLLDIDTLPPDARFKLDRLLRGNDILPFDLDPAVEVLLNLGIATIKDGRHCACRSPLVRELLAYRYWIVQDLPRLSLNDCKLLELPQVIPLLCDDLLFDAMCTAPLPAQAGFNLEQAEVAVKALVEKRFPEIDLEGIRFSCGRYFVGTPPPSRDEVLRIIAKVYLHWSKKDH